MKKNFGYILFLSLFVLLCLFPLAGMLILGPSEAAANEILAQPPAVKTDDGKLNLDLLNDSGDYLADHFALRQEMITANAAVEATVFRESAAEGVILGKHGWLYYTSTMDDYQGQNRLSERQIWSAAHCLSLIQEQAQSRNISFLFTVVPNKNTLYPEYMPGCALHSSKPGNLENLNSALSDADVAYLDLAEVFRAEDAVLYQKLDSHWNNLGAALAHDAICEALDLQAEEAYLPEQFTAVADHRGDLYQMLYPAGERKDVQLYPDQDWLFTYDKPIRSAEDQMIYTSCDGKPHRLLMFRDSFGNTLHSFMAESFGEACFCRAMPYTLSLLDSEQPDTLVIEIVERNIPWLTERAPVMPAPMRSPEIPEAQTGCNITLKSTQTGERLYCYSGCIADALDDDSPIYLLCDGQVYEASPAGDGEKPFTAYLPAQVSGVQVLFVQNGTMILSQPISCEE